MKVEDVFNEYVILTKRGRRLDRTGLPIPVTDACDRYLGRALSALNSVSQKLPKVPFVYADFVTNPAFNAFAFKYKDRYFIAIHDGLPVVLVMVIYRMLADRRLFRQIGDPDAETDNLPLITTLSPNAGSLVAGASSANVPKTSRRHIYAIHLCNLVFDFLTSHEIAHIANGHVDYIKSERGIPYLDEVEWIADTPEGNLEFQSLELDADSTAARVLVNTVKSLVEGLSQSKLAVAAFYQDAAGAMFDVAAAVSIMFRLFQDSRMNGVDLARKRHPPMRWRQMQILNMMANYVDQFWDATLSESVSAAVSKAIADLEEAFELVTGTEQQVLGLHDAWHGAGWDYAATVTEC